MINWQEINNKVFENIAYEYMVNNYPNLEWEKTKLTNDGNKDGESIISNLPFGVTIKYWYEAKYSINTNKSIPKSHLDSTLVSSILDGKVAVIAFITNAYISDDYKRRADIFAKHRDNLQIYYINGEELETWLSANPKIEEKYFKTHNAEKHLISDKIEDVCFFDKYNNDNDCIIKLSTIELNKEYFLYIRFNSSAKQQLELITDNAINILPNYSTPNKNPNILSAIKGNNAFFVPINVVLAKDKYCLCLKGENGVEKHTIEGIKTLDLYRPKLVISSQIKLLNDINLFIKSNDFHNLFFLITGEAGSGKTYTLNMLRNDSGNPFSSLLLDFTGNTENDIIKCYKLFIYCLFGNMWELDIDSIEQMNFQPIVKDVLKEISTRVSIPATYEKLIEYCSRQSDEFIEQYFLQQQIYIDNIHKISLEVAKLLHAILVWCSRKRLNKRIFLFSRNVLPELECLREFLYANTCIKQEIEKPTNKDVEASIQLNFGQVPSLISAVYSYKPIFSALSLYDFLCTLKQNYQNLIKLDVIDISIEITKILDNLNYVENCKTEGKLLREYSTNTIFNFVYKLEDGVNIDAFVDFFGKNIYKDIFELCQNRIIKEQAGKLYPFHDIILEQFRVLNKDTYFEKLGEFILFCIEKNYFSHGEGYSYLVALGGGYFCEYRSVAEKFREELHEEANYSAAQKIAQRIQKENYKTLFDYDYNDIRNLFVLGNCYKYTTSYELSNQTFKKIIEIYQYSSLNLCEDILLETYSEIINNNLWMLNIKEADSDLNRMYQMCDFSDSIMYKSKTYKYACLNYYNRRMFCDFMLGRESEESYIIALSKAQELHLREYEGFAHMDYAKSIYNIDIFKATKLLEKAREIFESENENRRLLDVLSELTFINVLQSRTYDISKLKNIYASMKERKYIQSYTRTHLKILVIMLLSGNYTLTELLDFLNPVLVKNETIVSGKRHQALVYHILASFYYKDGNLEVSKEYSLKCLDLFDEFGDSYKKIHFHNAHIKNKGDIMLGYEKNLEKFNNNFILDMRIW